MTSSEEGISHRQINIKHEIFDFMKQKYKKPREKVSWVFFSNYFIFYSLLYYCFYSIFELIPEINSQVL